MKNPERIHTILSLVACVCVSNCVNSYQQTVKENSYWGFWLELTSYWWGIMGVIQMATMCYITPPAAIKSCNHEV